MDISRIVDQASSDDKKPEHHSKAVAATSGPSALVRPPYPSLAPPPVYSSNHHSQTSLAPLAILNSPGGLVPPPSYPQLPPVSSLHAPLSTSSYAHEVHAGQSMPPPYGHVIQSLYAGGPGSAPPSAYGHVLPVSNHSASLAGRPGGIKRTASQANIHISHESPPKKMGKWTPEEDALAIELRRKGMKWEDISKRLPGRSAISCRLRYQNYSEKRPDWDEEKKNKLARLYNRFKKDMWDMIAKEMALPWRAVESMHWQMGCEDMANRANVPVFQPRAQASIKAQTSLSSKCKKSPSPSKHSDDNHGPSCASRLGYANSTSPEPLTRSGRSSSVVSPQGQEHKVKREFDCTRNSLSLAAMDEPDAATSRLKHESRGSQGSASEHEWGEHDRESTGTSHPSQNSHYSPRPPHSPRSHGHNGSIGPRQSVRSANPIMA